MSKYVCNDCGCEFDAPHTYRDYVGEFWGVPTYQTLGCCPECKSDDYEEVEDNDRDN